MAFAEDVREELLKRLADGESMVAIAQDARMPSRETVRRWNDSDETFRARYARAREDQADALFDEAAEIAKVATPESVQVARLQIDTIKWRASKLRPKVYGDKLDVEHSGEMTINVTIGGDA
jgi:hypothetical protein